jgi:hypothetical protein
MFQGICHFTQQLNDATWSYTWVKAHMDDILEWDNLTRPQQLNVMCDTLAKAAVEAAIRNPNQHKVMGTLFPMRTLPFL